MRCQWLAALVWHMIRFKTSLGRHTKGASSLLAAARSAVVKCMSIAIMCLIVQMVVCRLQMWQVERNRGP